MGNRNAEITLLLMFFVVVVVVVLRAERLGNVRGRKTGRD
jgi:hypothetical protein